MRNDDEVRTFSKKLKHLREYLGLSQEQLARALGVSYVTVSRWENGRHSPSRLALGRVAELVKMQTVSGGREPAIKMTHVKLGAGLAYSGIKLVVDETILPTCIGMRDETGKVRVFDIETRQEITQLGVDLWKLEPKERDVDKGSQRDDSGGV